MFIPLYSLCFIPLIVFLVECMKAILDMPNELGATVAVILGVSIGITCIMPGHLLQGFLIGLFIGLAAIGLYSSVHNLLDLLR